MTVDISLWPIAFVVVFFKLFPWVQEIVDRLVPKAPPEGSLKKLEERIGILEFAQGVKHRG